MVRLLCVAARHARGSGLPMRGANVVRRRSVTNPGETSDAHRGRQRRASRRGRFRASSGRKHAGDSGRQVRRQTGRGIRRVRGLPRARPRPRQGIKAGRPRRSQVRRLAPPAAAPGTGPSRAVAAAGSAGSRFALSNWRVRWRLAAVIAVPTLTAAVLGSLQIYGDVSNWSAAGRVQHLAAAQLRGRDAQPEAGRRTRPVRRATRRTGRRAARCPLRSPQAGAGRHQHRRRPGQQRSRAGSTTGGRLSAGHRAGPQHADRQPQRPGERPQGRHQLEYPGVEDHPRSSRENIINPANTFSAARSAPAPTTRTLQGNVTTLGALLRTENEMSVQRAILFAALSSPQGTLRPEDLTTLSRPSEQAAGRPGRLQRLQDTAEQQNYSNTVSGASVDVASSTRRSWRSRWRRNLANVPLTQYQRPG